MTLRLVDLSATAPQPWRNGGGVTRELLAWPGDSDWTLRLSVADIDRDGPFSAFPGIERWFTVLTGAGVRLGNKRLRADRHIHHFDGAKAPKCRLVDGPTRDLNLMIRRNRARGSLLALAPGDAWKGDATLRGVFTLAGTLRRDGEEAALLPAFMLAWQHGAPTRAVWRFDAAAYAFECEPHREPLP